MKKTFTTIAHMKMQPLSTIALPGTPGCPGVFELCAFIAKNDTVFIGFIANKFSNAVQIYPTQSLLAKEDIKLFQPLISQENSPLVITPTLQKAN